MNKSESIKNLMTALGKFQQEVGKIAKSESNPFFHSSYADLPSIMEAIKAPLSSNKLVISQHPTGEYELTTILFHTESGEYLESTYKMEPAKKDPQGAGSLITYARRYAIGAILGLVIDEDDDGNKASGVGKTKSEKPAYKASPNKPASEAQIASIFKGLDAIQIDLPVFAKEMGKDEKITPKQLNGAEASDWIDELRARYKIMKEEADEAIDQANDTPVGV